MKKFFCYILIISWIFSPICLNAQDDNQDAARQWHMNEGGAHGIEGGWNDDGWSDLGDAIEAGTEGLDQLNDFLDIYQSARNLYNDMQTLDRGECAPDFSVDSRAMMPSTCAGNAECGQCYQSAVGKMNFVRQQLGRMRCIWMNTKAFTESAISFGDNVAGLHGAMGLAWQHERGGIQETYNHFKQTYDNKYRDLIQSLQNALMDMDACEAQYGQRDWYQRFGFMFLEIMKEKYKRTD